MKSVMKSAAAVAAAVAALSCMAEGPRKPKALLVMMDGLRADVTQYAHMPNLRSLMDGKWAEGYSCAWSVSGQTVALARPSSAANHVAISTGVRGDKSRVYNNGQTRGGNYAQWPTWLSRVANEKGAKALYIFSWGENKDLGCDPKVQFIHASDQANGANLPKILAAADAPDAIQYFIDLPDHGGHGAGFYPWAPLYLSTCNTSDRWLGDCLAAIKARPTFAQEDWLIMLTGDHGGYARTHGIWGGHCTTVPVVISGRGVKHGRIPGTPTHYDLTASALAHFGFDVAKLNLDGKVVGNVVAPTPAKRPLSDGLVSYQNFDGKAPANGATVLGLATKCGAGGGLFGGCLHVAADTNKVGGVKLNGTEKLKFEDGCFAFTLWARLPAGQGGDSLLFGNKDWDRGINPGIALVAAKATDGVKVPGVAFNCGLQGNSRIDMGTYDIEPNAWTFYAVVRDAEGTLAVYQGRSDGRLYRIASPNPNALIATGLPLCVGQDGTGKYPCTLKGDVDDFALWTRALCPCEIKRIFESGRRGAALSDLL